MKKVMLYVISIMLVVVHCQNQDSKNVIEKISEKRPIAIEIKRERSYFQAEKINTRLRDNGVNSYIMSVKDSTAGGQWYAILVGAIVDSTSADSIKSSLQNDFRLDSLLVLDYTDSNKVFLDPDSVAIPERKQIVADKPGVPEDIFHVIEKFPNSNMFYIKNIDVVNCNCGDNAFNKMTKQLQNLDLPRGIHPGHIFKYADAWAETIYTDNIYGDQVTIDVIKLKKDHNLAQKISYSGMVPTQNSEYQLKIAEHFADFILNTDEYPTEEKDEMSEQAYDILRGYKVIIEAKPGVFRTYLVLVDQEGEFVFFCQSTAKSFDDLRAVVKLIGKGVGMNEFDEFYNAFYLIPSQIPDDDTFLTFSLSKLDWSYAKAKGYAEWSKKMVGHWTAEADFINQTKGNWSFSVFDLLTPPKVENIYYTLYSEQMDNEDEITVWGKKGYRVDHWFGGLREVNFAYDRFISCVNNSDDLNLDDMIDRAHLIQFYKGGYANLPGHAADSTQTM